MTGAGGAGGRTPAANFQAASRLMQLGRVDEAEPLYRAVLAANPRYAAAHHQLGLIQLLRGQDRAAADSLAAVVRLEPGSAAAHCDLGDILRRLGRPADAAARYRAALARAPDHAGALDGLGLALQALGDLEAACSRHRRAAACAARPARPLHHLATALMRLGRPADAVEAWHRALAAEPGFSPAHDGLGVALLALGRAGEAAAAHRRALALDPAAVTAHINLATALLALGRPAASAASCRRALAHDPGSAAAWYNRGAACHAANRFSAAEACYDRAIALDPDHAEAHWNRALARLTRGDYAKAWPDYGWRRRAASLTLVPRPFAEPAWAGEPPAGRTILVHADQGLGDSIQFARYLPLLAARGARVVLEVQRPLKRLFQGLNGVSEIVARGDTLPQVDLHCPVSDLPALFATTLETIPPPTPLRVPATPRPQANAGRLRVGLVWAGNPANSRDHLRSMPLETLRPILERPGIEIVSLQTPLRVADAILLEDYPRIANEGGGLRDFVETAAWFMTMDLVLSVDTAAAHLAGTLGRPTWVMLAHAADWRWHAGRTDCPWYPSARLFRQKRPGDWGNVVAAVSDALDRLTSSSA